MGISQEILKLIACLTMLVDHIGYVFLPYPILRIIGRLAYPIYAFLLCQGLQHTKNPRKYLLRMLLVLLITELPYDLLFRGEWTLEHQNVMFTLLLGLLMGLCIRKASALPVKLLLVVPFALLAELARTDYGGYGILIIALFLFSQNVRHPRLFEAAGLFFLSLFMSQSAVLIWGFPVPIQLFTLVALIPISLYNGKKSTAAPVLQWGFYLFYPVHLVILFLIQVFISSNC